METYELFRSEFQKQHGHLVEVVHLEIDGVKVATMPIETWFKIREGFWTMDLDVKIRHQNMWSKNLDPILLFHGLVISESSVDEAIQKLHSEWTELLLEQL